MSARASDLDGYEAAVRALDALKTKGWRLGLDRMEEFVRRAGLDGAIGPRKPAYLHVAGTNGKGSVTAYLQRIIHDQGWRAGGFYSPYVYDLRERVQVGLEKIPKDDFTRLVNRLMPIAEGMEATPFEGPTEFEFKTALGFAFWKDMACDFVALEVGLGGRLDATNVVTPAACAIASIGLDHMDVLGPDLTAIAGEKAGIIKPRVPVAVGLMAGEALERISGIAREREAPLLRVGQEVLLSRDKERWTVETPGGVWQDLRPGIPGRVQGSNVAVAIACAEAAGVIRDPSLVSGSISGTRLPGRFQRHRALGVEWILDGAHNQQAAETLAATLASEGQREVTLLTGMLAGHEAQPFYRPLAPFVAEAHIAPINFHRAKAPADLRAEISGLLNVVAAYSSVADAIEAATQAGRPVLVTGSFYLVGEVGRAIGADDVSPRSG